MNFGLAQGGARGMAHGKGASELGGRGACGECECRSGVGGLVLALISRLPPRNFTPFLGVWRNFGEIFNISRTWDKTSSKHRRNLGEICPCRSLAENFWLYFANPPQKRENPRQNFREILALSQRNNKRNFLPFRGEIRAKGNRGSGRINLALNFKYIRFLRNTRAPHFTPQHWLLCHMELY